MDLKQLQTIAPWEWPPDIAQLLAGILRDDQADAADRLIAAKLAGDYVVINDELVGILLDVLRNRTEPEVIRAVAAIALGPGLEIAYIDEEELLDNDPFSRETYHHIVQTLGELYSDDEIPLEVRRCVLEASVRAPQDWHPAAVRAAYDNGDDAWKMTAVFCMRFVRGFDEQILEALDCEDPLIRFHAVRAAGTWQVDGAWPHMTGILDGQEVDKDLLLAAIEAAAWIRPNEASLFIGDHLDSDDEDISLAATEAIGMAEGLLEAEENEDGEDDFSGNHIIH